MPGPASVYGPWGEALLEAVAKGTVDEALIDDKVVRILRLAARVGALADLSAGPPTPAPSTSGPPTPAPSALNAPELPREAPDSAAVAQEPRAAAAAGFVLV